MPPAGAMARVVKSSFSVPGVQRFGPRELVGKAALGYVTIALRFHLESSQKIFVSPPSSVFVFIFNDGFLVKTTQKHPFGGAASVPYPHSCSLRNEQGHPTGTACGLSPCLDLLKKPRKNQKITSKRPLRKALKKSPEKQNQA